MKKLLLLTAIHISAPTFAASPIDIESLVTASNLHFHSNYAEYDALCTVSKIGLHSDKAAYENHELYPSLLESAAFVYDGQAQRMKRVRDQNKDEFIADYIDDLFAKFNNRESANPDDNERYNPYRCEYNPFDNPALPSVCEALDYAKQLSKISQE